MIKYARQPTDRLLQLSETQVQIWNLLAEGPKEAAEITRRTMGVGYFEIMNALLDMKEHGDVVAIQED